jgi:hypothetical protein
VLPSHVWTDALLPQSRDNQVGQVDGGGTIAKKENPLVLELAARDLERVDQPGERDAGRALDVVIIARNFVAVAGQQGNRIDPVQSSK